MSSDAHWSTQREAGSDLAFRFMLWVDRWLGRWAFRVVLAPVALFYFVVIRRARTASLQYLRKVRALRPQALGHGPLWWYGICHLYAFGESMIDKVVAWAGGVDESAISLVDPDAYAAVKADSRGKLVIGSHFGSLELCRAFAAHNRNVVINVVLHDEHAARFVALMKRLHPDSRLRVVQVKDFGVAAALDLRQRIANGEWVVIAADRIPPGGDGRTVTIPFLGEPARFPIGPFILAYTLQCPVALLFAHRERNRIVVLLKPFGEAIELPRKSREQALQALITRYVRVLEERCLSAPLQWFNFYPFWEMQNEQ